MTDYELTETDLRKALLNRGHTEAQVASMLGRIKAGAWDEGYEAGWHSSYGTATPGGTPYEPDFNPYRSAT